MVMEFNNKNKLCKVRVATFFFSLSPPPLFFSFSVFSGIFNRYLFSCFDIIFFFFHNYLVNSCVLIAPYLHVQITGTINPTNWILIAVAKCIDLISRVHSTNAIPLLSTANGKQSPMQERDVDYKTIATTTTKL